MFICPVCNGLRTVTEKCPSCGGFLKDKGRAAYFKGPYSPYMETRSNDNCVHVLYCVRCDNIYHYHVDNNGRNICSVQTQGES